MKRNLAAPSAGQPIQASFFAEILREIRANRPLSGKNTRTHRTPNGTHIEAVGSRAAPAAKIPGLFTIGKTDDGRQIYEYPYYMVGTRLYRASDEDMWFSPGQTGISCLCVDIGGTQPRAVLYLCETFAEVQELAEDPTRSVKPLYEFKDGVAIRDFRNMPTMSPWEFER